MSATGVILEFAAAHHVLPPSTRAAALRLLADTLAVGGAGAASPEAQRVIAAAAGWGAGDTARSLGGGRMPAATAAFVNGFAVHCLEWDAVHEGAVVHALSVVTASLLAASDRQGGCESEAFLTALAVGVDIASGLGIAATGPMRFFRPATAGIIGATLAVARLEGISAACLADALGLAYSFAGGTMQAHVEASIALPLQIANAARAAITAVDLARAGLDGPHDVFDGPFGYSALIEPIELERYTSGLGHRWQIENVATKPFPSGRASHGALGALAELREQRSLGLDDVERITLFAPPLIHRLVGRPYRDGMTPAYARLCLPLLAPMMLRDGLIDPALFDSAAPFAPELAELAERTCVELDGNPDGNAMAPQRLCVTLTNGETIEQAIPAALGSIANPMSPRQADAKRALCRRLCGPRIDPRLFDDPLSFASEP